MRYLLGLMINKFRYLIWAVLIVLAIVFSGSLYTFIELRTLNVTYREISTRYFSETIFNGSYKYDWNKFIEIFSPQTQRELSNWSFTPNGTESIIEFTKSLAFFMDPGNEPNFQYEYLKEFNKAIKNLKDNQSISRYFIMFVFNKEYDEFYKLNGWGQIVKTHGKFKINLKKNKVDNFFNSFYL